MCGAHAEEARSPTSHSYDFEQLIKTLVQDYFYVHPIVHLSIYKKSKIKIPVK